MNIALRLAVAGASVLALTAPTLAQSPAKPDRAKVSRYTAPQATAPVAMRRPTAPVRSGTDWDFLVGIDQASSPFGHGGY